MFFFFQVRISHFLRFVSIYDLFTDSVVVLVLRRIGTLPKGLYILCVLLLSVSVIPTGFQVWT
jgi:hypothetical protein